MTGGHFHWVFQAADFVADDQSTAVSGIITVVPRNGVEVTVIGHTSEDAARASVEELVVRQSYVLTRVYECNTCAFQAAAIETMRKATG